MHKVSELSKLLVSFNTKLMRRYPVSTGVNSVANDDQECCVHVELAEIQRGLFVTRW